MTVMTVWINLTIGLVIIIISLGLAIWYNSLSWKNKTTQLIEKLLQTTNREKERVSFEGFDKLPMPVARYFRRVLKEGQPLIRSAFLSQKGQMRTSETTDTWCPFNAKEYFSANPSGFLWDATINMLALVKVKIRDMYCGGRGSIQGNVFSLIPIVNEHNKVELNAGALHRYLAEAVWFPTALLPSQGIKWTSIDSSKALATLSNGSTTVSLEFTFNDAGEVTEVFTPRRYREVKGKYELTPWRGYFSCYEERFGMKIPIQGEVEWALPEKRFSYWKGQIVNVMYSFA